MKTIAVMVENSRAYGRSMIEGIAAYAQERRGWTLRPLTVEEAFTSKLDMFDGVIARIANDRLADRLTQSGLPIVDTFCQRIRHGVAGVDSNHADIAHKARTFLQSRGFQHLAYCGIPGAAFSNQREAAFAEADTHIYSYVGRDIHPIDESQFYDERVDHIPDVASLAKWVHSLPKPIAIFCCNDLRAIQLQQVALGCGLRVPQDVALLGVDNDTILCSFAVVPISSIDPNAFKVGYAAARVLRTMMERPVAPKPHPVHHVPVGGLIERRSTEFMPIDPPWLGEVLLHIERNMRRPIGASEIFALARRSSTTVETVFRHKLGTSVQGYIGAVKLEYARKLIANPALRISEIGVLCGFASPQYFCRAFATRFGLSPRAFRHHLIARTAPRP